LEGIRYKDAMRGFITEENLPEIEEVFPGFGGFFKKLSPEDQKKPFLILMHLFEKEKELAKQGS